MIIGLDMLPVELCPANSLYYVHQDLDLLQKCLEMKLCVMLCIADFQSAAVEGHLNVKAGHFIHKL